MSLKLHEIAQRIPQKVLTSSREVDEFTLVLYSSTSHLHLSRFVAEIQCNNPTCPSKSAHVKLNKWRSGETLSSGGNVLMLDEPTNDLDVTTLRALEVRRCTFTPGSPCLDPGLTALGFQRLKLKCDELISSFAFNLNLRRYMEEALLSWNGVAMAGRNNSKGLEPRVESAGFQRLKATHVELLSNFAFKLKSRRYAMVISHDRWFLNKIATHILVRRCKLTLSKPHLKRLDISA